MAESPATIEPRARALVVFPLLLASLYLTAGPLLRLSQWTVPAESNHGLMEARAWREGRLDLPGYEDPRKFRPRDTALVDGKVYNVFPPLFSFLSYAAITLQHWQDLPPADADGFYAPWYVAIVALPLPLVGFWAFRRAGVPPDGAALMTAAWLLATPLLKMLCNCRDASTNELNHVLTNAGLMLAAGDLVGRRRGWPAAVGLLIAAWTRQITLLYYPAAWLILRGESAGRRGRSAWVGSSAVVAVATLGLLNQLKFGSPIDSGYGQIYEGRTDLYAQRAAGGLFSADHAARNAWHMNLSPPRFSQTGLGIAATGHPDGTSIWLTMPLLIFAAVDAPRWWADRARRLLMLASLAVIAVLLFYHNTGSVQRGFYRFSLDFVPIWLLIIAPYVCTSKRLWLTLGCVAYGALYFNLVCQNP